MTKTDVLQFTVCHFTDRKVNATHAGEGVIMKYYNLLVFGKLYVQFNSITFLYSSCKSRNRIFRDALIRGKKSPVCKKAMQKCVHILFPSEVWHNAIEIETEYKKQDENSYP